jgi:hypothetical protein
MTAPSSCPFAAGFRTRLQPVCSPFQHQSPPLCRLTATKIAAESPPSRPHFAAQPAPVPALLLPVSPPNCSRVAARLQPVCHQTSTSPGPLCRLSATKSAPFHSPVDPCFAVVLRPSALPYLTRTPPLCLPLAPQIEAELRPSRPRFAAVLLAVSPLFPIRTAPVCCQSSACLASLSLPSCHSFPGLSPRDSWPFATHSGTQLLPGFQPFVARLRPIFCLFQG